MYTITKHPDELCHYGVLGMKWGVRRYQNYDGTRIGTGGTPVVNKAKTAEGSVKKLKSTMDKALNNSVSRGQGGNAKGNARFAASAVSPKTKEAVDKLTNPSVKQGKGRDDITPAEKITRDTKKGADATKDIVSIAEKHANKRSKEAAQEKQMQKAKKMSDKELRDSINRIKMEREYTSLTTKETESGWTKAKEVLEVVGDVAEIAGAVVGVYVMLKKAGIIHSDMTFEEFQNEVDPEFIMHFTEMDDAEIEDYLEHYGVLGMKWGVRRYQNYDGTRIGSGKNPVIDQVKKAGSAMSTSRQMNADVIRPSTASSKKSVRSKKGVGTGIGGGAGGALKRTGYAMSKSQQMNANIIRPAKSSSNNKINSVKDVLTDPSKLAASAKKPNTISDYKTIKNIVPNTYGSVQIKKRTDNDSYVISDGKYVVRTNQELKENQQAVANMLNSAVGLTSERQVEKYFKKNPEELNDYKQLLDYYMETSWSSIVKEQGTDTKATREKKAAEAAAQKKQENAINSVYKELEKNPAFNKMSQDEQDLAWWEYVDSHPEIERQIFGD